MKSRERQILQDCLREYTPEALWPQQEAFPDDYYDELFRLNGWEVSETSVKEHPLAVARWTQTFVYDQLPEETTSLEPQITEVVTLFRVSDTMEGMWRQFETLKHRQGIEVESPFLFDGQGHTMEPMYEEEKLSDFNRKLMTALQFSPKE